MSIAFGKALTVALLVLPAAGLSIAGFRMARRGLGDVAAAVVFALVWFVIALTCVRDPHIGKPTASGFGLWYPIGYAAAFALDFEWEGTNSPASPRDYPYVRGGHIIGAYFGHYQGIPWRADVDAFWGFDDTGKLIDFHVRKCYDAL